jgi:hypothetical protein
MPISDSVHETDGKREWHAEKSRFADYLQRHKANKEAHANGDGEGHVPELARTKT